MSYTFSNIEVNGLINPKMTTAGLSIELVLKFVVASMNCSSLSVNGYYIGQYNFIVENLHFNTKYKIFNIIKNIEKYCTLLYNDPDIIPEENTIDSEDDGSVSDPEENDHNSSPEENTNININNSNTTDNNDNDSDSDIVPELQPRLPPACSQNYMSILVNAFSTQYSDIYDISPGEDDILLLFILNENLSDVLTNIEMVQNGIYFLVCGIPFKYIRGIISKR